MKLSSDEFRKLQLEWYQKLTETGFKDIEELRGNDLILTQSATYCYRKDSEFSRRMKENYFRCISQMAHDEETDFRNDIDRTIMIRHSEGACARAISEETKRHRHSVRFIIRKYEMEWGLAKYSDKQLNVKSKLCILMKK